MKITLVRIYFDNLQTIGALQIDGIYFCDTQEGRAIDWKREKKVSSKTAIPEGEYQLHLRYNSDVHKHMTIVETVPNFQNVMILSNRDIQNICGHINIGKMDDEKLVNGNAYLRTLVDKISEALEKGEQVALKVRSRFNWT